VASSGLFDLDAEVLAASALRDLVAAPGAHLVAAEDLAAPESVVDDRSTAIGVRVALLAHRRILDGTSRWLSLLADDAPTTDLVVTIRAAALEQAGASRPDPATRRLAEAEAR
jgi:hypothetical protein